MKILIAILSIFVMTSCSSLSKEECQMGNWYDYGNRDANKGLAKTRYLKHAEACQEHGISVNREQYMSGFNAGLESFCSPENGYSFALSGGNYLNTCPPKLAAKFKASYNKGKKVYDLKSQIKRLSSDIDSLSSEMTSSSLSRDRRTSLMYEIREKERKKSDLEKRLLVIELKDEMQRNNAK